MMQPVTATNPQTGEKVQWDGSNWVPVGQAQQPAVTFIPPNPNSPRAIERQQDAARDDQRLAIQQRNADRAEATAAQSADLAERKFEYQQQQDAAKGGGTAKQAQAVRAFMRGVDELEQLYRDKREGSKGGILGVGGERNIASVLPWNPFPAEFDDTSGRLLGAIKDATGATGGEMNSLGEIEARFGPMLPKAGDTDENIERKIAALRAMALDQAKVVGVDEEFVVPQAEDVTPSQPQVAATGETRREDDPALAGVEAEYRRRLALVGQGEDEASIIRYLRNAGVTDGSTFRSVVKQIRHRRANPDQPLDMYSTGQIDDRLVNNTPVDQAITSAAMSPTGTYLANTADALTAGYGDNVVGALGGDAEQVREAIGLTSDLNPGSALAGQVTGATLGMLGAEAGLAARGMQSGGLRSLLADAGYGAAYGSGNADDGSRLGGALEGALYAGAGNLGGQAVIRGVSKAISPTGRGSERLYEQGVRPTPGQRALAAGEARGGLSEMLGRAVNATEEGLGSVPIVGAAIRGARAESVDQFQIGAFNQALEEIGEKLPNGMTPGTGPHKFTQAKFNAVYDKARSGMVVRPDEQLMKDMEALGAEAANLAEPSFNRFAGIVKNVVMRRANNAEIDGNTYKTIITDLNKQIDRIRRSKTGDDELAEVLSDLRAAIDNGARRHSPKEAVDLMDAADRGYAKYALIEEAAGRVGGDAGQFTPAAFDRAVQKSGSRVRSKAYLQGEGLMQDYAQQGKSLTDRIPNSGTPERLAVGGSLAGGAAYVEPSSLGLLGMIGALYSPAARKALKGSIAPRGPKAQAVSRRLGAAAPVAGHLTAAASVPE
ncbi:hypothetical protein WJS89_10595 [Sphingomicrobium sp. XHP0235]|uniref:hypothetical protein n=1 Tax=Sphingomicrobium aquimarinum TaxID=3133971 RepID=UPI0031FEF469